VSRQTHGELARHLLNASGKEVRDISFSYHSHKTSISDPFSDGEHTPWSAPMQGAHEKRHPLAEDRWMRERDLAWSPWQRPVSIVIRSGKRILVEPEQHRNDNLLHEQPFAGPAEAILSEKYKIFFAPAIFLHFGY
jgi:hypothetical protein